MKKIISLAVLVLACTLYSCSGDSSTPQSGGKITIAEDIGGQQGQLPVPPPPSTKP